MEALWGMRVVLWCAAGSIAVFAAAVNRSGGRQRAMLMWGGLLTFVFGFDEALRLHEEFLPQTLGLSEQVLCSFYAWLAMVWLARFRAAMPAPPAGWLLSSIALFAGAIAVEHIRVPHHGMIVGSLKLLGVACWGGFFVRCGLRQLHGKPFATRVEGELLTLSQQEQARMSKELDATAATMEELMALAREAAAKSSPARVEQSAEDRARELMQLGRE